MLLLTAYVTMDHRFRRHSRPNHRLYVDLLVDVVREHEERQ